MLLGGLRLLFLGDVPFIADEPVIIAGALDAIESGRVATTGLQGTRGAAYGALPTAFYEATLLFTSDLRWVAAAKVVTFGLLTGTALIILGRSVPRLAIPLGAFAFLSPYLWFYARDLWDNSFAIPFSAMVLASYVAFHVSGRLRWLACSSLFASGCVLTHLMTMPLLGAVSVHFLVAQRRRLAGDGRFAAGTAALGLFCIVVLFSYVSSVSVGSAVSILWSPSPRSLLFAADGFRIFTLRGFDYVIGDWEAGGAAPVLVLVSCLTYGVGAYGLFLLNRSLRDDEVWKGDAQDGAAALAGVVALTLVFFVVLANGKRLVEHPHYYSGVWMAFFVPWWWGMSDLLGRRWARRSYYVQFAAMAAFLLGLVGWLHTNHGTRSLHYGPTLGNQMEVARELNRVGVGDAPPSAAHHPRLFPQAIRVLRRLEARAGRAADGRADGGSGGGVEIRYARPDGADGEIVVWTTPPG